MKIDLVPAPQSDPVRQCPVCGRQNVVEMIYQTRSDVRNSEAVMCRECYDACKALEWQAYRDRQQETQKQNQIRKAAVQEAVRRLRQDAETLP